MFHFKTYSAMMVIGLLAACGGGGGGGPQTVFTYQTFENRVPGTSTIAAAGLTRSAPSGLPDGTEVQVGTLDREPRTLSIAGVIVEGELQSNGTWLGSNGTIVSPSELAVFANTNYDFLLPVTVDDGDFEGNYIVGVVSRTQDLPTDSGTVNYTGQARVDVILGGDGATPGDAFGSDGELTLTADFANGLVDVVIDELNENGMPFDTVRIDDLVISSGANATFERTGTGFTSFASGLTPVEPALGPSTTESASGAFFGGDPNGPVEAGGVFSVNGANGNTIFGIFAAD
ncbi:hypothetical protein QTO30_13570 [Yoonia sp. GPGPB17]|uniref:hypothetical protein n=1 Tax=Yoonia sp. GPGPB17 TaxID=3026147 RepID=UPI0030BBC452